MQDEKLAYTVEEAARKASCGRTLLYGAIQTGELASLKIGKKRLVTHDQLVAWLERHAAKAAA